MYDLVPNMGQIPPSDHFKLGHQNDGAGHLWCVIANTPHGQIPAKVLDVLGDIIICVFFLFFFIANSSSIELGDYKIILELRTSFIKHCHAYCECIQIQTDASCHKLSPILCQLQHVEAKNIPTPRSPNYYFHHINGNYNVRMLAGQTEQGMVRVRRKRTPDKRFSVRTTPSRSSRRSGKGSVSLEVRVNASCCRYC